MNVISPWKAYAPQRIATPAFVADIELSNLSASVSLDEHYQALRMLIRIHGCPVGYVDLPAPPARHLNHTQILRSLGPDTIERATQHLLADLRQAKIALPEPLPDIGALIELLAAAPGKACSHTVPNNAPLISVAICTRNRAHSLPATLDSLLIQTYTNIEILVIDNGSSTDATERLIHADYPGIRYIFEDRSGLNNARNRAMAEARGEIVAFIDDDARADPDWVAALVPLFDDPKVMCATGLVVPAALDTPGQDLFERYGYSKGFYRFVFRLDCPPPHCPGFPYKGYLGTGCNCALRRNALTLVGAFDPRLDMGTPVPGGGDHDMFARIIRAGFHLVYDPQPVVFHLHLADLDTVIDRLGEYQESFMAFITKAMLSDRTYALPLLSNTLYSYVRKTVRGIGAVITKRDRPARLVLSEALGLLRGPISLYRSHRQVARTSNQKYDIEFLPPESSGSRLP